MFKRTLLITCAAGAFGSFDVSAFAQTAPAPAPAPAAAADNGTTIGELVVTAERREENLQDTPLAVSAFSADTLKNKKLEGGEDLLLAIPDVNYTRSNFGGFNFKIRGIGTDVVAPGVGSTAGVSINENELPVSANNFANAEFFDVDRVEIVRGPQGTLYGKNATGGAVDVITTQPSSQFGGYGSVEYGNYNTVKATGALNIPLGDAFALRVAGVRLVQGGFGVNTYLGTRVDGRDLGAIRTTLSFKPNDRFSAYLLYEHFGEDDNRNRVGKQLCTTDNGPSTVGGVAVPANYGLFLNQGCLPGSLYNNAAYGVVNSNGTVGGQVANSIGLSNGSNLFAGQTQDHNLHNISSVIQPLYTSQEDLVDLHLAYNVTDNLTLTSITGYNRSVGTNQEDYARVVPNAPFQPAGISALLFPGGVVRDPQLGASNRLESFDYGYGESKEYTQEVRLTSSYKGKINFALGGFYSEITGGTTYIVENNAYTALSQLNNFVAANFGPAAAPLGGPIHIQPNAPADGSGHNYYDAHAQGNTKSYAGFGEVYYDITPQLKLTLGGRYTVDQTYNLQFPTGLASATPNNGPVYADGVGGYPSTICTTSLAACQFPQRQTNRDFTGRANIDYTPTLSFTDKTLVYASYGRGFKNGGFNGAQQIGAATTPPTYAPEFIDAYEIGTKNTLLGGSLTLNADGFYYNYQGYQIAQYINQQSVNLNINAKIYGVEFEGVYSPIRNLTLNINAGYLHSSIDNGVSFIDRINLTQGNPAYTTVKNGASGQNCIAPTAAVAAYITAGKPAAGLYTQCALSGANQFGIPVSLGGNKLPNTPPFTVSVGAQYVMELPGDLRGTLRGDFYAQGNSFSDVYNSINNRLEAYHVVNATLTVAKVSEGLDLQFFVKNLFNAQPITGTYLSDPSTGLFTNVFTLDPRTYGAQLTKRF